MLYFYRSRLNIEISRGLTQNDTFISTKILIVLQIILFIKQKGAIKMILFLFIKTVNYRDNNKLELHFNENGKWGIR